MKTISLNHFHKMSLRKYQLLGCPNGSVSWMSAFGSGHDSRVPRSSPMTSSLLSRASASPSPSALPLLLSLAHVLSNKQNLWKKNKISNSITVINFFFTCQRYFRLLCYFYNEEKHRQQQHMAVVGSIWTLGEMFAV